MQKNLFVRSSKNFIKASASFLSSQTLTEYCSKKRSNRVIFGMFCRHQIQSVYLPRDCEIVNEIISFIIITVDRPFHTVPNPLGFIPWLSFAYSAHFIGIQPFIKPIKDQLLGRKSLQGHQSHTVELFIFANSERKAHSVINTDFPQFSSEQQNVFSATECIFLQLSQVHFLLLPYCDTNTNRYQLNLKCRASIYSPSTAQLLKQLVCSGTALNLPWIPFGRH